MMIPFFLPFKSPLIGNNSIHLPLKNAFFAVTDKEKKSLPNKEESFAILCPTPMLTVFFPLQRVLLFAALKFSKEEKEIMPCSETGIIVQMNLKIDNKRIITMISVNHHGINESAIIKVIFSFLSSTSVSSDNSLLYFSATSVPETSICVSEGGKKLNNLSLFKISATFFSDSSFKTNV